LARKALSAAAGSRQPGLPHEGEGTVASQVWYIVTTGDTLFSIGLRYGSSVEAIAAANGIVPPYFIYPGQSLTIPAYADSTYVADTMATHTVTSGETLFFIAQQYGVTTQSLVAANGLANPNQIRVGQTLNIPY
jgi:LysM repeat protein